MRNEKSVAGGCVFFACFALLWLVIGAEAGLAEDRIRLEERVSDEDFYRAVACYAKPGARCRRPFIRWGATRRQDLRIALARIEPGYPKGRAEVISGALDDAIAELNAIGADITLRRVAPADKAEINVFLLDVPPGTKLGNRHVRGMGGVKIGFAVAKLWFTESNRITRGVIAVSNEWKGDVVLRSVMLEELTQALGFMVDLEGPGYQLRSIFSETESFMTRLREQDKAAILLHYPPGSP